MRKLPTKLPKGFKLYKPVIADYQLYTINYGILNNDVALLLHMGLGKTYCALQIARYRIQFSNVDKVLILSPATLLYNWQEEINEFTEYNSIILHGSKQQRKHIIDKFLNSNYHFGIINYEALAKNYFSRKVLYNYGMVIADESAKFIKSIRASRTNVAIDIADMSKYRMILTGTPISNKPLDVWSQYRFLTQGRLFGTNFYSWRHHYFYTSEGKFKTYTFKKHLSSDLNKKIYSTSIRFGKECRKGKLPKELFKPILLRPDYRFYSIYNEVRDKILAEIETEGGFQNIKVAHVLTKRIRLQQITSGFIKVDGVEQRLKYTPKLDTLEEHIDIAIDADESVVIWCWFRYSIKLISDILMRKKIKHIVISGADSSKEKTVKWKKFQKSKTHNVFIGQIASGGIGINLFKLRCSPDKSQHMIFYEGSRTLDEREQALGRIDRVGVVVDEILYKDLIIKDTIDELSALAVKENKEVADMIIERKTI